MRQRFITTIIMLLTVVLQTVAQTLTDRYNKQRPVVIVCNHNRYKEVTKDVMDQLNVACKFMSIDGNEGRKAFEQGDADLIIDDARNYNQKSFYTSKSILSYNRISADTIAEICFVGKDRQLMEQIDDQYARLRQDGEIATILERWEHPELAEPKTESIALRITNALIFLTLVLLLLSLILLWHIRNTRRHTREVKEMTSQAKQMNQYYAIEDNRAAHDLMHKYETILCNPYVAISFYDNNGQLIVENEAMKQLDHKDVASLRQPLYNTEGEVTNYLVAIRLSETTI